MKLSAYQLRNLAAALESLAKIPGTVNEFEFEHTMLIKVQKHNATDQRDENTYYLVGVEPLPD